MCYNSNQEPLNRNYGFASIFSPDFTSMNDVNTARCKSHLDLAQLVNSAFFGGGDQ